MFDLSGISKSSAIFDVDKLTWMNGEYIRALSVEEFLNRAKPYLDAALTRDVNRTKLAKLIQPRLETLAQIPEKVAFFNQMPDYSLELYTHKKMKTTPENSLPILQEAREALAQVDDFSNLSAMRCMRASYSASLEKSSTCASASLAS